MNKKDPAFLFYPSDFLTGTYMMTYAQKGKYITLLCLQQQQGHLPVDVIKEICGKDDVVIKKFAVDDKGLYYNNRLEAEINKRAEYSIKQRENAKKRWKNNNANAMPSHSIGIAKAMPLENENIYSSIDNIYIYNNKDNKDNKDNKRVEGEKKEKKEKKDIFEEYAAGNEELLKALRDFAEMRNRIKKPMTDRAKQNVLGDLRRLLTGVAEDKVIDVSCAIINQSIKNCWLTFYKLKDSNLSDIMHTRFDIEGL